MPKEKKTRYALLGLLQRYPMSGYDLKKLCNQSIGCFWNENYSNIYSELKTMQIDGLVTMEIHDQEKAPNKKVYTITESGVKTLKEWLNRSPEDRLLREELLLQVGFGYMTDKNIIIDKLKKRKMNCEKTLEQLQDSTEFLDYLINTEYTSGQKTADPYATYMRYTLSFGLKFFKMELDWCKETIAGLQNQAEEREGSEQELLV